MSAAEFIEAPDERVVAPVERAHELAHATGGYAYEFIDVGDPERLVEVRCFAGRDDYVLTVVSRRGYKPPNAPVVVHSELPVARALVTPLVAALVAGSAGLGFGELLLRLF